MIDDPKMAIAKAEASIDEALKPFRPRIEPVPDNWRKAEEQAKAERAASVPVRNVVQFLNDIEARISDQSKDLADILRGLDERLKRIESSISGQP